MQKTVFWQGLDGKKYLSCPGGQAFLPWGNSREKGDVFSAEKAAEMSRAVVPGRGM
jgi:hypothetical protein